MHDISDKKKTRVFFSLMVQILCKKKTGFYPSPTSVSTNNFTLTFSVSINYKMKRTTTTRKRKSSPTLEITADPYQTPVVEHQEVSQEISCSRSLIRRRRLKEKVEKEVDSSSEKVNVTHQDVALPPLFSASITTTTLIHVSHVVVDLESAHKLRKTGLHREASQLYQLAADQGDLYAKLWLAYVYISDFYGDSYFNAAFHLCQEVLLLKKDNPPPPLLYYVLGRCYSFGYSGLENNYSTALELYEKGAELGNANCQNQLGSIYQYGNYLDYKIKPNIKKAVHYYRLAVAQDCANAQYNLASCYQVGEGVPRDPNECTHLYRLWAKQEGIPENEWRD